MKLRNVPGLNKSCESVKSNTVVAEHVKDGIVIIQQEHIVFANAGLP